MKFLSNDFYKTIGSDELNIPHWLTYGILCFTFAYLGLTIFLATIDIIRGRRTTITANHEAEDLIEEVHISRD